jgi:hypothetical protein
MAGFQLHTVYSHMAQAYLELIDHDELILQRKASRLVRAWSEEWMSVTAGDFSFDTGEHLRNADGYLAFSDVQCQQITEYIRNNRGYILAAEAVDYFTLPQHFTLLDDDTMQALLASYHPWHINWEVSAKLQYTVRRFRDFRWNRAFFNFAISQSLVPDEIEAYRTEWLTDIFHDRGEEDETLGAFLQRSLEVDNRSYRDGVGINGTKENQLWRVEGAQGLYLRRYIEPSEYASPIAEYVWIDDVDARAIESPAPQMADGRIPNLL